MAESQDTEITLGTGKLLALFFGLVVICAVFFGLGFSLGRNSVKTGLTLQQTPEASSQTNAGAKSDAGTPAKVTPPPIQQPGADNSQTNATPAAPAPVVTSPTASTSVGTAPAPEMTKPASAAGTGGVYTVQVAAVSKQEDAQALVDALKKKSYPVFVANAASDSLFHVQVGPFADIKDAEAMKTKLASDGYNPIVKR